MPPKIGEDSAARIDTRFLVSMVKVGKGSDLDCSNLGFYFYGTFFNDGK